MKRSSLQKKSGTAFTMATPDPALVALAGDFSVSQDQIARRAYEIWQQRGRRHGNDWEHWILAEWQLLGESLTREEIPDCV